MTSTLHAESCQTKYLHRYTLAQPPQPSPAQRRRCPRCHVLGIWDCNQASDASLTYTSRNARVSLLQRGLEASNVVHTLRGSASWASPGGDGGVSNHPPSLSFWPWEGVRCLVGWEVPAICCLQHRDQGLGDAHGAPAAELVEREWFEGRELFETWVGVCAMAVSSTRLTPTPLHPGEPDVVYTHTVLENFERISVNQL